MDHGNLVFRRHNPAQSESATGQRSLYFLGARAKAPRMLATAGGQSLTISGGRVRRGPRRRAGLRRVRSSALEVIAVASGARTTIDEAGCGMDGQWMRSPAFVGKRDRLDLHVDAAQ